ncbi:MAG TPA: hypothetical protein VIM84_12725 [Gemmatimonadales bacterium]
MTKQPTETRCQTGHRLVWEQDGKGLQVLDAMTGLVIWSTVKVVEPKEKVVRCPICGTLVLHGSHDGS